MIDAGCMCIVDSRGNDNANVKSSLQTDSEQTRHIIIRVKFADSLVENLYIIPTKKNKCVCLGCIWNANLCSLVLCCLAIVATSTD